MDVLLTDKMLDMLMIATTFSVVLMALIQKIKSLGIMKNTVHIALADLLLSLLGIPFGMLFYNLDIIEGLWVSIFSFIEAPTIYQILKAQNVINYKPKSLDDYIGSTTIEKENVIERKDG